MLGFFRVLSLACVLLPSVALSQSALPATDPVSDAVGTVAGGFRVDESGQATYRIPIAVTPGVAGVAPDLALVYSSQAGEGAAGFGWSVAGASQIGRCRRTHEHGDALGAHNYLGMPVRLSSADVFCLDGQRLLLVSGAYGAAGSEYRPELDPFTRVTAVGGDNSADPASYTGPASFRVERRDGTVQTYGGSDEARLSVAGCGGQSGRACAHRQWLLSRVEDANGNYLEYGYAKWRAGVLVAATADADEIHLAEVRYTGKRRLPGQNAPDAAPFARVVFTYAARPLWARHAGWQAGAPYQLSRELTGIGVYEPLSTEVRHYALEHRNAPSGSGQRLLHRVRECTNASQTLCYPATEFAVNPASHALTESVERDFVTVPSGPRLDFRIGDIDGDGRQDIAWALEHNNCGGRPGVHVLFGAHTGSGSGAQPTLVSPSSAVFCLQRPAAELGDSWHLFDYDGDGRDDLLLAGADGTRWQLHRSLGRPTGSLGATFAASDSLAETIPVGTGLGAMALAQLHDFNGDGLLDIAYPVATSPDQPGENTAELAVRLGHIDRSGGTPRRGFGEVLRLRLTFASTDLCRAGPPPPGQRIVCSYGFKRSTRQLTGADFDGDGRGDLMLKVDRFVYSGPPNRGEAVEVRYAAEGEAIAGPPLPHETLVDHSEGWYLFTSEGVVAGDVRLRQYTSVLVGAGGVPARADHVHLADLNGDGLQDVVYVPQGSDSELRVRLNSGQGLRAADTLATDLSHVDHLQLVDLSGDGRADVVHPTATSGSGAVCGGTSAAGLPQPLCLRRSYATANGAMTLSTGELQSALQAARSGGGLLDFDALFLDLDGDGHLDYVRLSKQVHVTQSEALLVRRAARYAPRDAITAITDGFGATTQVHYQPLTNRGVYRPAQDGWKLDLGRGAPVFDLLAPMYVVAGVESSAPLRGQPEARVRTDYRYAGARMQSGGRGFLGFAAIDAFDANEIGTAGQYGVSRTKYVQHFPYVGAPERTEKAIGSGSPSPAEGVSAGCRSHAEAAADCFSPTAADWSQTPIAHAPGGAGNGPRLHAMTINVYQSLEFGVPAACAAADSITDEVETLARAGEYARAGSRRAPARGSASVPAIQPVLFGTLEESYSAVASATGHQQLSRSFTAFCYEDGYGNLTRGFTDVRDPASGFAQRLHFTDTASSFDNGQPLQANQPWRLGRLLQSTVTKSMPSTAGSPVSIRKAHFSYDLTSQAKTGQLLSERVEVSGQTATRTLYTLDDYGNRTAAYVCSDTEWDGSPLTDAECRDRSRIRMRPTQSNGEPTAAVHRYTRTEFDARGRYPLKTWAPFYSPGATHDLVERVTEEVIARNVFGQMTHSRDTNGRNVYTRFGALGRAYATELQGGALGVTTLRLCGGTVSCPPEAVYRQQTTSSAGPTEWSYHDRLGQPVLIARQSFAANDPSRNVSAVCSFRDLKARPVQTSVPFFLPGQSGAEPSFSGSAANPCGLTTNRFEQKSYDLLSRPIQVIAPDASVLGFAYAGMTVIQTNALGQKSWETRNVLGQVVSEVQAAPTSPALQGMAVTHQYDAEGQRRFTRRNAGGGEIVSEQRFDALGRLSQSLDPDRGTERFEYNAAGEMIRRLDAANQEVVMHYDAQGRLWKRESGTPAQAPPPTGSVIFGNGFESGSLMVKQIDLWQHDTALNGWGQLHSEERQTPQGATFRRTYAYDGLGRPSSVATLIEGQTRTASTTYDGLGRVWTQTDATGGVLEQVYTPRGFVEQLRNGTNLGQVYNRVLEVDARGQVTRERRGDSVAMEITRIYDAQRGWLTAIDAGSGQGLQKLRYRFDALGRLTQRDDQRLGQKEDFGYDALNRLRTATVTLQGFSPLQTQNLQYDALGNLCSKNGTAYTYAGRSGCAGSQGSASASPHAVTSVGGRTLRYDAQGRMTFKAGASSSFDRYTEFNSLDQLVLAVSGNLMSPTAELQLNYTPGGDRYLRRERTSAGLTTTRVYGNVEEVRKPNGTVETRRTLAGVVIETRMGTAFNAGTPELRYLFTDHLGSLDVIANVSGVAVERLSFDVHGRRRQVSDWRSTVLPSTPVTTPRGFTGHEHLDAFALIHMNGRVYDPELGRFLQADPVLDAGIQGMNRYSYVLNNPLSLTDPSGHLSVGEIIRIAAAVVITVYTGGAASAMWTAGAYGSALTTVALGGAFAGMLTTGTTKGGVQGAFGAMAFFGVGSYFEQAKWAQHATEANKLSTIGRAAKIVAHGVTGGVLADVQGGKFGHGFASAGFSEAAGPITNGVQGDLGRGIAHALIGGTASKLSGGKFSNGAVTAAMGFAFNYLVHGAQRQAAQKRLSLANARMLAKGGMRPFDSADDAAMFWHEHIGPLAGNVEFGSYIFRSGEKYFLGPVGSSFDTSKIEWAAFGRRSVENGAGLVGLIHSHPNNSGLSGQGEWVLQPYPAISEVFNAGGRPGDLGIAWNDGYRHMYASSRRSLHGWSQELFLNRYPNAMATTNSAFLNIGQYCLIGDCK